MSDPRQLSLFSTEWICVTTVPDYTVTELATDPDEVVWDYGEAGRLRALKMDRHTAESVAAGCQGALVVPA